MFRSASAPRLHACSTFAGFPAAIQKSGTLLDTREFAPMTAYRPIRTLGRITLPNPISAPSPISTNESSLRILSPIFSPSRVPLYGCVVSTMAQLAVIETFFPIVRREWQMMWQFCSMLLLSPIRSSGIRPDPSRTHSMRAFSLICTSDPMYIYSG